MFIIQMTFGSVDAGTLMRHTEKVAQIMADNAKAKGKNRGYYKLIQIMLAVLIQRQVELLTYIRYGTCLLYTSPSPRD